MVDTPPKLTVTPAAPIWDIAGAYITPRPLAHAAGVAFLIGTRVRSQTVGGFPGLLSSGLAPGVDSLGNQRATSDFRVMNAALMSQWMGADAAAIIPGADTFQHIPTLIS